VPQPNESAAGKQIKHNPLYYKITINENLLEEHSEAISIANFFEIEIAKRCFTLFYPTKQNILPNKTKIKAQNKGKTREFDKKVKKVKKKVKNFIKKVKTYYNNSIKLKVFFYKTKKEQKMR